METKSKTIISANLLTVETGTNCPMGGDGGHGGLTTFMLKDEGSTGWNLYFTDSKDQRYVVEDPRDIEIDLYGDCENYTFIKALEFAARTLKKQVKMNESTDIK
jgi:hypothetical protein